MPWRGCSSSSRLVMINRREFVASVTIAIVASRAVVASGEQEQLWEPDGVGSLARIGVLTPDDDPVPESEMRMMAPDGVSIHASRVLWKNGDWRSFADGAPSAAELLMRLKTRLILYAFTSSSYVLGEEADNRLPSEIEKRAGGTKVLFTCPAAVEALHLLGARRVALIHPPWFGQEAAELSAGDLGRGRRNCSSPAKNKWFWRPRMSTTGASKPLNH